MIRIVSDGDGAGTQILDAETGEDLSSRLQVSAVRWEVCAGGLATATLTLACVQVDAAGEMVIHEPSTS